MLENYVIYKGLASGHYGEEKNEMKGLAEYHVARLYVLLEMECFME